MLFSSVAIHYQQFQNAYRRLDVHVHDENVHQQCSHSNSHIHALPNDKNIN